jgi:hypothetical protein
LQVQTTLVWWHQILVFQHSLEGEANRLQREDERISLRERRLEPFGWELGGTDVAPTLSGARAFPHSVHQSLVMKELVPQFVGRDGQLSIRMLR